MEYLRESAEGIFAGEEGANLGRETNPPPRTGSRPPSTPRSGAVQRVLLSPFRLGARDGVVDRCGDGSGVTAAPWGFFLQKTEASRQLATVRYTWPKSIEYVYQTINM